MELSKIILEIIYILDILIMTYIYFNNICKNINCVKKILCKKHELCY